MSYNGTGLMAYTVQMRAKISSHTGACTRVSWDFQQNMYLCHTLIPYILCAGESGIAPGPAWEGKYSVLEPVLWRAREQTFPGTPR